MEKSKSKKKTRQTRQSSKENKDEKIESEMDGTNIGEHITYDVLRMILEYSNIRDLTRAAMVCRSWNEAAKKEILIRMRPQNILYDLRHDKKKDQVLQTFTDQLLIRPNIGLLFMGKQQRIRWCGFEPRNNDDCPCRRVPHQTNCITVWNYGLVHDDLELEGNVVSGLFLPKIPGVKMKCFTIGMSEVEQFRTTTHRRSREKLARKFLKISPNEDNIKSIILFENQDSGGSDEYQESDAKQILRTFLSQQTNNKDKISIWGGFASTLTVCTPVSNGDSCNHTASLAGISICGAGVSTWSIVLDSRIKTKGQLEKELIKFRDGVKLQKHSVGFMFACCGRGEDWYGEKDVEPKAFRKFFPNVPLVGSFGGGEFGSTTISQECSKSPAIVYEYSTIFLILSYGSMRKI